MSDDRIYKAPASWPEGAGVRNGFCAVYAEQLRSWRDRGEQTSLVQLVKLVTPAMTNALHIFQGLKRPCRVKDNLDADQDKLIFVSQPLTDFEYSKALSRTEAKAAPAGKVLTVIVSPIEEKHRAKWPDIDGWIEHWAWVDEARDLQYAPVNYSTRYGSKLWSRQS